MHLLEVQSLSKTYGSGNTAVHALKNVSFAVSVAAGIRAPIKRLNEMSITETIGQL